MKNEFLSVEQESYLRKRACDHIWCTAHDVRKINQLIDFIKIGVIVDSESLHKEIQKFIKKTNSELVQNKLKRIENWFLNNDWYLTEKDKEIIKDVESPIVTLKGKYIKRTDKPYLSTIHVDLLNTPNGKYCPVCAILGVENKIGNERYQRTCNLCGVNFLD